MYDTDRVDRNLHLAMLGTVGLALTPIVFVAGVMLGATTVEALIVTTLVGITAFVAQEWAGQNLSAELDRAMDEATEK